jgi:hypothetical protein
MQPSTKTKKLYYNSLTGFNIAPEDWQERLKAGDFFELEPIEGAAYPTIYGEILQGIGNGYFKAVSFSKWCPSGQVGKVCLVEPTRQISKEEFEAARTAQWEEPDGN